MLYCESLFRNPRITLVYCSLQRPIERRWVTKPSQTALVARAKTRMPWRVALTATTSFARIARPPTVSCSSLMGTGSGVWKTRIHPASLMVSLNSECCSLMTAPYAPLLQFSSLSERNVANSWHLDLDWGLDCIVRSKKLEECMYVDPVKLSGDQPNSAFWSHHKALPNCNPYRYIRERKLTRYDQHWWRSRSSSPTESKP